ncbi:MAG: DUF3352 domain-containing protein [Bacteroidales bacterium]|nr:DUF3352 domain-containing protein [Bacteroidales bacterium]
MLRFAGYIVAVIITAVVFYLAVNFLRSLHKPQIEAIDAVPPNAIVFIEFSNPGGTWEKLSERSALWGELCRIKEVCGLNSIVATLDSLMSENTTGELLKNQKLTAAISRENGVHEVLFIMELSQNTDVSGIDRFVKQVNGERSIILNREYKKAMIRYVNIPAFDQPFQYTTVNNLLIAGFNENSIQSCIDRLEKGNPVVQRPEFLKVRATAGKNVDANIYFHFGAAHPSMAGILSPFCLDITGNAGNFASWSELDLIIKNDEILLNGYTATSDTTTNYLDVFRHEPHQGEVTSILPYNTTFLTVLSTGEIERYLDEYRQYLNVAGGLAEYNRSITEYPSIHGADLENRIIPLIGDEVALAITSASGNETRENLAGIIRLKDAEKAFITLGDLSLKDIPLESPDLKDYDYNIKKLPEGNLMECLFGPVFHGITENYYIILKDYLVLANNPEYLVHQINSFYGQKTLDDNYNFETFSDNISDRTNLQLYCNIRKSIPAITSCFQPSVADILRTNQSTLVNFEGIALQFSYINNMFFTNVYIKYNPEYREVNPSNWEAVTDAPVSGKPFLIRDHITGRLKVIVFDEMNTMYLIDHEGRIKWKIPLMQQPVGDVFMVDAFKNRKIQYIFNTADYLYLIDLNGNYVGNFPVKLASKATNGISVTDYDKLKDYRILVAGEDNRIYNYDMDGKQVEGWSKPIVSHKVVMPVEYLTDKGKDYIIVTDETGSVYFYNRRGETRFSPEKALVKASNSVFYINKTNSKGFLITTDRQGRLCYLTSGGSVSDTQFDVFSAEHCFFYSDFDNNQAFDFIFTDNQRIAVFDRQKNLLLDYYSPEKLIEFAGLFEIPGRGKIIGVISEESGKVLLFDKSGMFEPLSYISGKTPFVTGSLNNDDHINLIICEGNKVYNYLLN